MIMFNYLCGYHYSNHEIKTLKIKRRTKTHAKKHTSNELIFFSFPRFFAAEILKNRLAELYVLFFLSLRQKKEDK